MTVATLAAADWAPGASPGLGRASAADRASTWSTKCGARKGRAAGAAAEPPPTKGQSSGPEPGSGPGSETERVGIRVDSGDIAGQCVLYFQKMRSAGIGPRTIVFEDEVTPEVVHQVYDRFRRETGQDPTMLFPGAGGYWWRLVHRDTVAAAFKRSATGDHPNIKFSNSPGKESLGGYLRVHGRDDVMVIADASEDPVGEPLFVQLVREGRIVYRERFEDQAARAEQTWGRFRRVELSPKVADVGPPTPAAIPIWWRSVARA